MKKLFLSILFLVALGWLAACAAPTIVPSSTATSASVVATNTPIVAKPSAAPTAQPTNPPTLQPSNYPTRKPNILFILTDDLDIAAIAFMPKLQELLVKQGVLFDNYFVNVSLCCPSRSTILRGEYSQGTQIFGNQPPDGGYEKFHANHDEESTIAVWLQNAGYRTMLAGKYLNGYPNTVAQTFVPPGWTEWYSAAKGNAYGEYNYTLNENGKLVEYGKKPEDYGTDVYARKTIDFIQRSAKEGKPFFAYVAPYAPHAPSTPAPRHANLFADAKLPRSPNFNEPDASDKPGYIKNRPQLTDRQIRQIEEQYRLRLQSLQAVDEMIENLINTLKAAGQLDNTYLFFMSDNGFHLGNHRLATGKWTPYEEDVHVPLIVRGPGVPVNVKLDHLTGNNDLAPTWAELAGIKTPDFVDGRSLVSLIRPNPPALTPPLSATGEDGRGWRQCYLLQRGEPGKDIAPDEDENAYVRPPEMQGLLEPSDELPEEVAGLEPQRAVAVPAFQGIHLLHYVYIEYATGEKEFYDLRADLHQLNNLAAKADPALLKELAARLNELQNCTGDQCRVIENRPFAIK
jgi:arylsulfatase A-like enzyme